MIIGMPKGYVYYRYRPFVTAFAEEIGVELKYVDEINQDIIDRGSGPACKGYERSDR